MAHYGSVQYAMLCPKCHRNGALGKICPNCGTELFSVSARIILPNTPRAWRRFLREKGPIRDEIDDYNANPVKDWLTIARTKAVAEKEAEVDKQYRLLEKRQRATEASNPVVEILDIVCIKDQHTSMPYDGLNQSAWFLVKVNRRLRLYNTTSLRVLIPPPVPPKQNVWDDDPPPPGPYGIPVGKKCKLSAIVKRRLNAAIKKFLK